MPKKTKQQEIEELKEVIKNMHVQIDDARMRAAKLAEEKHAIGEQLEYVEEKYNRVYDDYLILQIHNGELLAAAKYYLAKTEDQAREMTYRGAQRAKHDPEYAAVRELLRSKNELSAQNLRVMVDTFPKLNLRKLILVAAEFSRKEKEKEPEKPLEVRLYLSEDGWERKP